MTTYHENPSYHRGHSHDGECARLFKMPHWIKEVKDWTWLLKFCFWHTIMAFALNLWPCNGVSTWTFTNISLNATMMTKVWPDKIKSTDLLWRHLRQLYTAHYNKAGQQQYKYLMYAYVISKTLLYYLCMFVDLLCNGEQLGSKLLKNISDMSLIVFDFILSRHPRVGNYHMSCIMVFLKVNINTFLF